MAPARQPTGDTRSVKDRGVPTPAWATEPPVWGEPVSVDRVLDTLERMDRKKVYRFAYPDGRQYETTWQTESGAKSWASINGHRYLGEVKTEEPVRPVRPVPRDIGSRGTEPDLSPPPLVQAPWPPPPPPPKKKGKKKKDPDPDPVPPPPPPKDDPIQDLRDVHRKMNQLRPKLEKSRHEAKSKALDSIPGIGFVASAIYDFFVADDPGSGAKGLAEEGLEKSIEHTAEKSLKKALPPGWTGPKDAWELHEAMMELGENVKQMRELQKQEYLLKDKLGHPDARFDLPGTNFYMGPGGRIYDKRTGKPAPRY